MRILFKITAMLSLLTSILATKQDVKTGTESKEEFIYKDIKYYVTESVFDPNMGKFSILSGLIYNQRFFTLRFKPGYVIEANQIVRDYRKDGDTFSYPSKCSDRCLASVNTDESIGVQRCLISLMTTPSLIIGTTTNWKESTFHSTLSSSIGEKNVINFIECLIVFGAVSLFSEELELKISVDRNYVRLRLFKMVLGHPAYISKSAFIEHICGVATRDLIYQLSLFNTIMKQKKPNGECRKLSDYYSSPATYATSPLMILHLLIFKLFDSKDAVSNIIKNVRKIVDNDELFFKTFFIRQSPKETKLSFKENIDQFKEALNAGNDTTTIWDTILVSGAITKYADDMHRYAIYRRGFNICENVHAQIIRNMETHLDTTDKSTKELKESTSNILTRAFSYLFTHPR